MRQVQANYTFNATTKIITLTGLSIDQDQLLLITNATRGVVYYNFASSSSRATVTAGVNTTVVLTDASTTGHADNDQLIIHYEDQSNTQPISGTVTANTGLVQPLTDNQLRATAVPISGTVTVNGIGSTADAVAPSDSSSLSSIIGFIKRLSTHLAALRDEIGGGSNASGGLSSSIGKQTDTAPALATDSGSILAFVKRLNSAFDTVFGTSYNSLNNAQATFRISHPYGTFSQASPNYIIAPNTPQLVFSAKTNSAPRRSLQIQNVSDTPMYVGFGTTGFLANPMASGAVNGIVITNGGSGYGSAPSVTFSAPTGTTGRIATATGTAVISGGIVTSIVITDAGGGYLSAPTITFGSGSATATAVIGPVGWYVATTFGAITFDRGFIPNDAIYIACAATGKPFIALQG